MKKKILIATLILLFIGGGTAYYFYKRPNFIMHSQIDDVAIPVFKASRGKELCVAVKEEYKALFDIVYSEGDISNKQLEAEMRAKGYNLLATVNLPAKYGMTDPADVEKFGEFIRQCMAVHADNLMYFSGKI